MKQRVLEKDVQRSILDWLTAKRIFHYRNNSGAMASEYKGVKRFMRFGAKGSPDIVAVVRGRYVGIEVKGTNGRQNPDQKLFEQELMKAGGQYILAASIEDVEQQLTKATR
jgi:hypothetical protein